VPEYLSSAETNSTGSFQDSVDCGEKNTDTTHNHQNQCFSVGKIDFKSDLEPRRVDTGFEEKTEVDLQETANSNIPGQPERRS
jgi:hypothetical protein